MASRNNQFYTRGRKRPAGGDKNRAGELTTRNVKKDIEFSCLPSRGLGVGMIENEKGIKSSEDVEGGRASQSAVSGSDINVWAHNR